MGRRELLVGTVRDLHDAADGALKEQAVEALVDRLVEGKAVHTVTARDIFDDLLDDVKKPSYMVLLDLLDGLLALNGKAGNTHLLDCSELERKAKELITAYVLGRGEWIEEEADEIEASRDE